MNMHLLNNNTNDFSQNLFLMSQIKNQNKFNDSNFYNISNININAQFKQSNDMRNLNGEGISKEILNSKSYGISGSEFKRRNIKNLIWVLIKIKLI